MPGEGKLLEGREDADGVVGVGGGGREEEDGLRQVRPPGEALHELGRQIRSVDDRCEGIAQEGGRCEDVDLFEFAGAGHRPSFRSGRLPPSDSSRCAPCGRCIA